MHSDSGGRAAPPLVVTAITSPLSARMLKGQQRYLREKGFRTVIASAPGDQVTELAREEGAELAAIPMQREISPARDALSLARVIWCVHKLRPDIVNAGTPKAGLLFLVAAWLCRVPVRIYTLRGLRYESERGLMRWLLRRVERLTARAAHVVCCDSPSLRERALEERLFPEAKATVIGHGSTGIDLDRFRPRPELRADAGRLRARLGIQEEHFVIGFVGRIIVRKGIVELMRAWQRLGHKHEHTRLLLVGRHERAQQPPRDTLRLIEDDPRVIHTGQVEDVRCHLMAMDLVVLPSHWEGFSRVLLEAAALGKPVVTTDAVGCRDAVKAGCTGTIVPRFDVEALEAALASYIEDPELGRRHGLEGLRWVRRFRAEDVWEGLAQLYEQQLRTRRVAG